MLLASRTLLHWRSGSNRIACPCGCGEPVVRIDGGYSTPERDMREGLLRVIERTPAILASVFGKRNPAQGT